MRIVGQGDDDASEDEDDVSSEEVDTDAIQKQKMIVWDLMKTEDGREFLAEDAAKNSFDQLVLMLDTELSPSQVFIIKTDLLDECTDIIGQMPTYFKMDNMECRDVLHRQLTTGLGMLVERLAFKYKYVFNVRQKPK